MKLLLLSALALILSAMPAFAQQGTGHRVTPGKTHTNIAGVKLTNDANSEGHATIDPKTGTSSSTTTITTKTGFKGSVENLKAGDTVDLRSSNTATISGTGGKVTMSGNSTVTIHNTNTNPQGTPIIVTMASGATATVKPGSSVTLSQ